MEIRWIRVSPKPMAKPPWLAIPRLSVAPRMMIRNMAVMTTSVTRAAIIVYLPGDSSPKPLTAKLLAARVNPSWPPAMSSRTKAAAMAPRTWAMT